MNAQMLLKMLGISEDDLKQYAELAQRANGNLAQVPVIHNIVESHAARVERKFDTIDTKLDLVLERVDMALSLIETLVNLKLLEHTHERHNHCGNNGTDTGNNTGTDSH